MATRTHLFELEVFLTSGTVDSYTHDDPAIARRNLSRILPEKVFAQTVLVIGSSNRVATYPTRSILRLEVAAEELPEWSFGPSFDRMDLVDVERFREGVAGLAHVGRQERKPQPGEPVVAFAQITDTAGDRHYVEAHGRAAPGPVRSGMMKRVLEGPILNAVRGDVAVLFNPANVAGVQVYPGTPELLLTALEAEPVE